jgi:hypothetical protein
MVQTIAAIKPFDGGASQSEGAAVNMLTGAPTHNRSEADVHGQHNCPYHLVVLEVFIADEPSRLTILRAFGKLVAVLRCWFITDRSIRN